jgi:ATP phosphoribosyltransferase
VVHEILETEAILIVNPHSKHTELVDLLKRRIEGYITATKYNMIMFNVSVDLLPEAVKITPGKRSPTITNLDDERYKAVSSLVKKSDISSKMDQLHALGATDILVLALSNSRM